MLVTKLLFYILVLPFIINLYLESTPMKTIRDYLGILEPKQDMSITKYRLIELLNCGMCMGFVFSFIFFIVKYYMIISIVDIIGISAVVSILTELLNRVLNRWMI